MKNTEKSLNIQGIPTPGSPSNNKLDGAVHVGMTRTFGRRHGKRVSAHQQWLIDNILPKLVPSAQCPVPKNRKAILEIGFGAGEHLRELAIDNPNNIVIGAEPFMNGVASLLSHIVQKQESGERKAQSENDLFKVKPEYKNIRIWPDDVRMLLNNISTFRFPLSALQNINFKEIYILHPDPWPKARHEKRRLLNAEFLNLLGTHLSPGGQIIIGTDHHEYYDWIVAQLPKTNLQIKTTDFEIIKTRYMHKNKAGTDAPKYLVLKSEDIRA